MIVPERREKTVNGINMSYLTAGRGEPFLMIHGLLSNAFDFGFQFDRFAGRFECIAPDMRGAGMTRGCGLDSATLDQAVDDMLEFITDTIPLDTRFVLLGHSFGGIVAFELAAKIPERLRALVIVASPSTLGSNPLLKTGMDVFKLAIPVIKPFIQPPVINFYAFNINASPSNLTEESKDMLRKRNNLVEADDLIAMHAYLTSAVGREVPSPVCSWNIPSIMIFGDRDPLFGRRDIASIKKRIPCINEILIHDSRHSPMYEKPEEFNAALEEFLASAQ